MTGPQAGDRISEYILDHPIGAGSFGQVWKAHHHVWKTEVVAVKIPTDSQYVRNLQKEGCAIHGLRHPNIVRAIGLDPYADIPYLVMEYVDGPSLDRLIAQHTKGLPVMAGQRIICGVLQALDHAHTNGVIHRDVKPANILIAGGNSKPVEKVATEDVKVTDFGLGHAGEVTASSMLQSGSLLAEGGKSISGTLAYMAPEVRDGGRSDARSDLYAVGIVLFEMMTGERPSGSDMPSQVRDGLPSWVDPVYSRLYTRLDRRFSSAAEALRTIESMSVPPVVARGRTAAPPPIPSAGQGAGATCPSCGAVAEPGNNFCIMCGAQLVETLRRCLSCGGYPAAEDRYCIFCGAALSATVG